MHDGYKFGKGNNINAIIIFIEKKICNYANINLKSLRIIVVDN